MLTLTSPVETPLHRVPAGLKLAALCALTVVLFHLSSPLVLAGVLAGVAGLAALGGGRFAGHAGRMLWPLWPFVAIVAVWHGWTGDLAGGLVVILRMIAAVAAANLVTMTTRLDDMIAVVERLCRPLARVGVPPRALALAVALTIRFIPVLAERLGRIREAWAARSARRPGWRVLVPATLSALDDAEHVAEALRARGGTV